MKNNCIRLIGSFLIIVTLILCSCATTVDVSALMPAETYIGGKATIAIAPTYVYPYQEYGRSTANYASKIVENALKQGVFDVMSVEETDSVIKISKAASLDPTESLLRSGASVLVQSTIENMDYSDKYHERVSKDKNGKPVTKIYVERTAQLSMSFIVWDLKTRTIIDAFTLSDSTSTDSEIVYPGHSDVSINTGLMYQDILHSFKDNIRNRLVPHYDVVKIKLLKNKTKIDALENAYDYVKNGQYKMALNAFNYYWEQTEDPVSGYNCAVLFYALGAQEEAITFAENVFKVTGNYNLFELSCYLKELLSLQKDAIAQVEGSITGKSIGSIIYY